MAIVDGEDPYVTRAMTNPFGLATDGEPTLPRLEVRVERIAGKETSLVRTVDEDIFRIGSNDTNDLVLDDETVSRFHCRLRREGLGWCIEDAGSRNGTRLRNISVLSARLEGEVVLALGDSQIRVRPISSTRRDVAPTTAFGSIVGTSFAMRRLFAVLERIAASEIDVLITGESGTGKELIAAELIARSTRSDGPVVVVDCGAISPALIESELFGHVRGAFTGADRDREGALEAANGGTVVLDEIGELPLDLQPKFLRALEAREVRRVGQTKSKSIDVRILAATHRDLEREVNRGRFREDLYYRLAKVCVRVPPLRERLDDLPALVRAFLASADQLAETEEGGLFNANALAEMRKHDWPGNVRELRNHVERSIVLGEASLTPSRREPSLGEQPSSAPDLTIPFRQAKENVVAMFERTYLTAILERAAGNVSKAARDAKMDRMYLHQLAHRYGIPTTRKN
jgi:DNA-binding NtrC family response regulator